MRNLIAIIGLAISVTNCDKKQQETVSKQTVQDSVNFVQSEDTAPVELPQTCYLGITGKDSVFVLLDDNLGTITGKMRYKNFGKDSSIGDLVGSANGDTLKLSYTFEAEGTTSEREIFFLRKDGNLIEGIGEQKTEGNKATYTKSNKLEYSADPLKPAECNGFDKNFIIQ